MSIKKMANKVLTPLTHAELVTWAVYLLGGDQKHIDTEDIAAKVYELAPKRFSWRKYPKQINLELVRVYLSDAKKSAKGGLLSGSGRSGWSLTRNGLAWLRTARLRLKAFESGTYDRQSRAGSVDANRSDRERKRILSLPAWERWIRGDRTVSIDEAREVFRIDTYATESVREAKLTRLRAMFIGDEEISSFLTQLIEAIDK
jgi:hypothetical protein